MAPDGTYLVFESKRPKQGESAAGIVSNLWRVDRMGTGWSMPKRLPDTVNLDGQSLWKPSIAADGTIYFVVIDTRGGKRLFSSHYLNHGYEQAQPFHSAMVLPWMSIRRLHRTDLSWSSAALAGCLTTRRITSLLCAEPPRAGDR
jgi:hypothetical protein